MKTIVIVYDDGSFDEFEFADNFAFPVPNKPVCQVVCKDQKSSKARGPVDPVNDERIRSEHDSGKTLEQLASEEGISKQAVCKAIARAKKVLASAATQVPVTAPAGPSSDNIRVAAHLLLGGATPRKTIDQLKQEIKNKL